MALSFRDSSFTGTDTGWRKKEKKKKEEETCLRSPVLTCNGDTVAFQWSESPQLFAHTEKNKKREENQDSFGWTVQMKCFAENPSALFCSVIFRKASF